MIGRLSLVDEGRTIDAVLHEDGRWSCGDRPELAERLNRDFSPIGVPAAGGNWGHWELIAAAHSLGGRVSFEGIEPGRQPPARPRLPYRGYSRAGDGGP